MNAQLIPPLTADQVAEVAAAELAASIMLLENLTAEDWTRGTDCAGWTVHHLTAHMVGQYQGLASLWGFLRRHRRAHRRYPTLSRLDADNRQQIDDLGGLSGDELVAMLAAVGPKAIRARRRVPKLVRRLHVGRMYPEESLCDDRLSYMLDVLGLRDPWMHRVDLARATGRPLTLGSNDQLIVAQVIADLGRTWEERPVLLELTVLPVDAGRSAVGRLWPRSGQTLWITCVPCPDANPIPLWRPTEIKPLWRQSVPPASRSEHASRLPRGCKRRSQIG